MNIEEVINENNLLKIEVQKLKDEFISITDASKKLNLSTSTITNSCNEKIKHTRRDKFIFRFG